MLNDEDDKARRAAFITLGKIRNGEWRKEKRPEAEDAVKIFEETNIVAKGEMSVDEVLDLWERNQIDIINRVIPIGRR